MKTKRIKAFLIAITFAIESIAVGYAPVSAQTVSENTLEEKVKNETGSQSQTTDNAAEVVSETSEVSADKAEIVYSGKDGDLDWSIDSEGHLTITGTGDYEPRSYDLENGWLAYKEKIKSADVEVSGITSTECMFVGCFNMVNVDVSGLNTGQVTNMRRMFSECEKLESINLKGFDTSKVTSMEGMFYACRSLTQLDVSSFETGLVEDMGAMFNACENLVSLDLHNFDTKNVKNMGTMFAVCYALKFLNVSSFDTSQVTDMSYMFNGCSVNVNLNNFNTSKTINMKEMFSYSDRVSLDISNFDLSQVTNLTEIVEGCRKMATLVAPVNTSSQIFYLPTRSTWIYKGTGETVTEVTKAGTYICKDLQPESKGTKMSASKITTADGKVPANSTFTVTSDDPANPTVSFDGVANKNAKAVEIPKTITYNGITYKVTTVSPKAYTSTGDQARYKVTDNRVENLTVTYTAPTKKAKTKVTIPDYSTYKGIKFKVTQVSAKAFKNNKKLKQISIATSITDIGADAFSGCINLNTVTIGKSLKTVGNNAFKNCKKLTKITIKSTKLKTVGKNALNGIHKNCKIKVPKAKLSKYKKIFKNKGQKKTVKITK